MKNYTVTSPMGVTIGPGNDIQLTKEQSVSRAAALEVVNKRKSTFRTIKPVQFKAGEEIGMAATMAKALRAKLTESAEMAKTASAAAADAEAAEKAEADAAKQAEADAEAETPADDDTPPAA